MVSKLVQSHCAWSIILAAALYFSSTHSAEKTQEPPFFEEKVQAQEETPLIPEETVNQTRMECSALSQRISQFSLPVTINQSGVYCITENLQVTSANSPGITITTSGVVLNFNGNVMSGGTQTTGIKVIGARSVFIEGGTIASMDNFGIQAISNNSGTICRDLFLSNMNLIQNGTGISISNGRNIQILDCTIFRSTISGVTLTQNTNVTIANTIANDGGSVLNNANARGFLLTNNSGVRLMECAANANSGEGFLQIGGSAHQYIQCTANLNTVGFSQSNQSSAVPCRSNEYFNCFAQGNSLQGIRLTGLRNIVSGCMCNGNSTAGIQINGLHHSITNSQAKDNGTGFLLAPTNTIGPAASTCFLRNNIATNNNVGFLDSGSNNRIYENFSNNNFTNATLSNYIGITNVATSPTAITAINSTANISE